MRRREENSLKIILCTTPIRPSPTNYPPFGSMALMQSLRGAGYDPYFYDIDGLRPSFEQVVDYFKEQAPDVLGISAVVSTAYAYTKKLVQAIKEVSPRTKVVVGGNLAASSELLLRLCKVDVCGIGEGENVMVSLARYWGEHESGDDYAQLQQIKGITYLDASGELIFTGYDAPIPASDFYDPDWAILEQYSKIDNYIEDPMDRYDFSQDMRSYEPHRLGKRLVSLPSAKGCVARCTFCHRWDRGYRHWSVDRIMNNIQHLIDNYNVGFISFADENFGSDRRKLEEIVERLKPLDILWKAGGVRVRSVDQDILHKMYDTGCVALYYGIESGSPDMLNVMEKNATVEHNYNTSKWTHEAGIYTIYQLVLGMPGETHKTIAETSDFIQRITEFLPDPPRKRLSTNYIQALPGTPVYEYARNKGLIGRSLEDEEKYLINISDVDAADDSKFLNFTEYDYFSVQSWRPKIVFDATANWYQKHNWGRIPTLPEAARLHGHRVVVEDYNRGGYFNLGHSVIHHPMFYKALCSPLGRPLRAMYPLAYALVKDSRTLPKRQYIAGLWEFLFKKLWKRAGLKEAKSLRQVMKERNPEPVSTTEQSMQPLRDGR